MKRDKTGKFINEFADPTLVKFYMEGKKKDEFREKALKVGKPISQLLRELIGKFLK